MISARVEGPGYRYQALVGQGLLHDAGVKIGEVIRGKRCAIISDTNVAQLFGKQLVQSLTSAQFQPTLITAPAGEEAKSLKQVGAICDEMIAAGLDRQSFVIGLGGGVVGDLSGFVGSIFERGIPHVLIPTTLLAMVDSSIGGKTGVNTRDGKNLIGTFHHSVLIIDDVDLLKTLPPREFSQGFAEIIKHAVIADAEMFSELRNHDAGDTTALQRLIQRNIEIKANVVAKDELDRTGDRAILNFGHTIGHAIERAGNYGTFLHGEAISLGMVAACSVSMKRAGLSADQRDAIVDLLKRFDLPTQLQNDFPREKVLEALKFDKKFESGQIRFVVTPAIGSARLTSDVTPEDIREAIEIL